MNGRVALESRCLQDYLRIGLVAYYIMSLFTQLNFFDSEDQGDSGLFLEYAVIIGKIVCLVNVPLIFIAIIGFFKYDPCPSKVKLESSRNPGCRLCFSVVTRGTFPKVVKMPSFAGSQVP